MRVITLQEERQKHWHPLTTSSDPTQRSQWNLYNFQAAACISESSANADVNSSWWIPVGKEGWKDFQQDERERTGHRSINQVL